MKYISNKLRGSPRDQEREDDRVEVPPASPGADAVETAALTWRWTVA
jgi:hypothetical protein